MTNPVTTTIALPESLLAQAESLAQSLNLSHSQLVALALEQIIATHQDSHAPDEHTQAQRVINQGDIYWLRGDNPGKLEAGIAHPHVIIQDNLLNHSRLDTVVTCVLTSNLKRVNLPGNVLLTAGEANLPRQSVVEVSKVSTVAKSQLGDYIGSVSETRIHQILAGLRFLQISYFPR